MSLTFGRYCIRGDIHEYNKVFHKCVIEWLNISSFPSHKNNSIQFEYDRNKVEFQNNFLFVSLGHAMWARIINKDSKYWYGWFFFLQCWDKQSIYSSNMCAAETRGLMCIVKQMAEFCHVTTTTVRERKVTCVSYIRNKIIKNNAIYYSIAHTITYRGSVPFLTCNVRLSAFLTLILMISWSLVRCETLERRLPTSPFREISLNA